MMQQESSKKNGLPNSHGKKCFQGKIEACTLSNVGFEVEGKNKIFVTKWNSFYKQTNHQKVVRIMGSNVKKGNWFYSKVCKHAKDWKTHVSCSRKTIMPNWHMEWQEKKFRKLFNFPLCFICYNNVVECQNMNP